MKEIFKKPYIYWFFGLFFLYLFVNIIISGFYKTLPLIVIYFSTVNWIKLGISLILTLVIGFLVSINGILIYIKYKERKNKASEMVGCILNIVNIPGAFLEMWFDKNKKDDLADCFLQSIYYFQTNNPNSKKRKRNVKET